MDDKKYNKYGEVENIWCLYEAEKKKIENIGLTPREYEAEIERICDELGI